MPYPGEQVVTCGNTTCGRKMRVNRCRDLFTIKITLEDVTMKQTLVRAFPNVIHTFFSGTTEQIEDYVLSLEKRDFAINKKKILEDVLKHDS